MVREINSRESDGICVELLHESARNEVWLHVEDVRNSSSEFLTKIPSDQAMFAFVHPFMFEPVKN